MPKNIEGHGFLSTAAFASVAREATFTVSLMTIAAATLMPVATANAVEGDELQGRWQVFSMDGQTDGPISRLPAVRMPSG